MGPIRALTGGGTWRATSPTPRSGGTPNQALQPTVTPCRPACAAELGRAAAGDSDRRNLRRAPATKLLAREIKMTAYTDMDAYLSAHAPDRVGPAGRSATVR